MVGPTSTHHLKPSTTSTTIKFLCSYGGKILPRYPDGKLRYQGGETRVLAVHRSTSFSELLVKFGELCGTPVTVRCQLPTEDLDALVSITCNEDLINIIEEYDASPASQPQSSLKIRTFLSLPKKLSPTPSSSASSSSSTTTFEAASPKSPQSSTYSPAVSTCSGSYTSSRFAVASTNRCVYPISKPSRYPICYQKSAGKLPYYAHGSSSRTHLIHNGNHWQ